jgi:A/G-specific adenine glycosylase
MLQQTQVKTVIPFWNRWLLKLPTVEAAAKASSDRIHKLWEGLGYYTRVRNLQKAARQIVEKYDGQFPQHFDDVLALPGIGRYTAGAVCSIAFNQPTPILDGNVIRVLTRIFGIGKNPREKQTNAALWRLAQELVTCAKAQSPKRNSCSLLNQSLMELGALVCTPRQPKCLICPAQKHCIAFQQNRTHELPNLGKRTAAAARHCVAFVAEHRGQFLVRQRPAGVVNAHLWEFPNVETSNGKSNPKLAAENLFGVEPAGLERLCTLKHSITRYRITLEAYRVRLQRRPGRRIGVWLTLAQLWPLAFASAHKKLASAATDCILSGR